MDFRCHLKVASCNSAEKKIRVVGRGECNTTAKPGSDLSTQATAETPSAPRGGGTLKQSDHKRKSINSDAGAAVKHSKRKGRRDEKRRNKRIGKKREKTYHRALKKLQ